MFLLFLPLPPPPALQSWCGAPRDAPQGGPSHPTTSGILRSTSHPTNIYGALLGPSSQSRPDAEFDLAEVPTLKLGIRSGSRGAAWLSTSPSHRPQAPQLGCRVNDLVGSTGSNPLNLGLKVLGPHREARQIQGTQFVLSLVSHSKVGGSCLRVFPKLVLVGTGLQDGLSSTEAHRVRNKAFGPSKGSPLQLRSGKPGNPMDRRA